jgi:hypothetical protein
VEAAVEVLRLLSRCEAGSRLRASAQDRCRGRSRGLLHGSHKYFLFMNNTMVAMNIYYYHSVMVTIMVVVINC